MAIQAARPVLAGRAQGRVHRVRCPFCRTDFPVWTRGVSGARISWQEALCQHVLAEHPEMDR